MFAELLRAVPFLVVTEGRALLVESFMIEPEGSVGWTRSSVMIEPEGSVRWTVGGGVDDFAKVMVEDGAGGWRKKVPSALRKISSLLLFSSLFFSLLIFSLLMRREYEGGCWSCIGDLGRDDVRVGGFKVEVEGGREDGKGNTERSGAV